LDLPPLARGGHQERDRRPGTENVGGIVGFGVACALALATQGETVRRLETLRLQLLACLAAIPGARILGYGAREARIVATTASRLPGTVMVTFPGAPGQLVAIGLDLEGICVSTGAACSSGSLEPSPVLRALGLPSERAAEGVRISMGWTTTADDIARLSAVLPDVVARVRAAAAAPGVDDEPLRAVSHLLLQTAPTTASPRGGPS
jgi:cysteine desulfurase